MAALRRAIEVYPFVSEVPDCYQRPGLWVFGFAYDARLHPDDVGGVLGDLFQPVYTAVCILNQNESGLRIFDARFLPQLKDGLKLEDFIV